jgi:hypothetical protein
MIDRLRRPLETPLLSKARGKLARMQKRHAVDVGPSQLNKQSNKIPARVRGGSRRARPVTAGRSPWAPVGSPGGAPYTGKTTYGARREISRNFPASWPFRRPATAPEQGLPKAPGRRQTITSRSSRLSWPGSGTRWAGWCPSRHYSSPAPEYPKNWQASSWVSSQRRCGISIQLMSQMGSSASVLPRRRGDRIGDVFCCGA